MRAVLTWHSIDDSGSPISVGPAALARQLDWLAREGVRVVDLDDLVTSAPEGDAVALTFDDGFASVATEAAPRLAERGWPATVFVVTEHVGGTNAWGGREEPGIPTLPLLGWAELGRLAEQGIRPGSHTRTHARLSSLGGDRLEDELAASAERIARETGTRPRWLAYPYGDVDRRVAEAASRHYDGAVTTEHRALPGRPNRALVPRIDMYYFREPGRLPAWDSAELRRSIWLRRQARAARAALSAIGVVG